MVTQLHFTAWPDHGAPEHATGVLNFYRTMIAETPSGGGPVLVHCRWVHIIYMKSIVNVISTLCTVAIQFIHSYHVDKILLILVILIILTPRLFLFDLVKITQYIFI